MNKPIENNPDVDVMDRLNSQEAIESPIPEEGVELPPVEETTN